MVPNRWSPDNHDHQNKNTFSKIKYYYTYQLKHTTPSIKMPIVQNKLFLMNWNFSSLDTLYQEQYNSKYQWEANTGQITVFKTPTPKQEKMSQKCIENNLKSMLEINCIGRKCHKDGLVPKRLLNASSKTSTEPVAWEIHEYPLLYTDLPTQPYYQEAKEYNRKRNYSQINLYTELSWRTPTTKIPSKNPPILAKDPRLTWGNPPQQN